MRSAENGRYQPLGLAYRPEIDGLRAIAVTAVILFHANFQRFAGGYVGVDVFFVISGYLIASILLHERNARKLTLRVFYERRIRRIVPALFAVLLASLVPAWFLMRPSEFRTFIRSLMAASLFVSNAYFWRTTDYFNVTAENPTIHTWTLGVEEQFYILFPLFLVQFWSPTRRRLVWITSALAIASLGLSEFGWRYHPQGNYFLAPTRAWELLIGVLVALASFPVAIHRRVNRWVNEVGAGAGFLAIIVSVFVFDQTTKVPSVYMLLPTVGAASIIAFAAPSTLVARGLSVKWVVGLGLISYSAYLWHQPIFAFVRLYSFVEPSALVYLCLLVVVLCLACFTWKFIERPFKNPRVVSTRSTLLLLGTGCAVFVTLGGAITDNIVQRQASRFSPYELAAIDPGTSDFTTCPFTTVAHAPFIRICSVGARDSNPSVAFLGDSHAYLLARGMEDQLSAIAKSGIVVQNVACLPIPGIYDQRTLDSRFVSDCVAAENAVMRYLREQASIKVIVLGMRWTQRLYPVADSIKALNFDNGEGGVERSNTYAEYYAQTSQGTFTRDGGAKRRAIRAFLGALIATGKTVAIVYPVPETGFSTPNLALKRVIRHDDLSVIHTSYERYKERNAFAENALNSFDNPNIVRIKPAELMCDTFVRNRCLAMLEGKSLYFDPHHLSLYGTGFITPSILRLLH
jgi:peptidoglycan/LPS O-acetylase OafA/YrhL